MFKKENYNPKQNYYFVDYTLWENGHSDYGEEQTEKSEPSSKKGYPRWIRMSFQTEQDIQETMNYVFEPYPNRITNLKIRSEEELNEVITIEDKTNERLWDKEDEKYKNGLKITLREYHFGNSYQFLYEHKTGVIDGDGNLIGDDIPEGLNLETRSKIKEKKGQK